MSSHVRIFSFTSSTNIWDVLGLLIVGVAFSNFFGRYVSLSLDRMIVAIGALLNDDNGSMIGQMSLFSYSSNIN